MFFSIIVPVYNVEQYLRACVDSVLGQSFSDFELILVDDGSADGSGALCDAYAARDERVRVVHKANGGQSSARNEGVRQATGRYAVFLDSDDFFSYPDFLRDLSCEAVQADADVVVYRYQKYYTDRIEPVGVSPEVARNATADQLLRRLVETDTFFCSCWSKTVRMSILKDNGVVFDENLCCEDMDWYYTVLRYAKTFAILDKECINYRQRENSVTSSFKKKSITDYIFTLRKWKAEFEAIGQPELREVMLSSLGKLYCNLLISYSRHRGELKAEKKDIFAFRDLLRFDLNPRTAKFRRIAQVCGLSGMCALLNLIDKVR